MIQNIAAAALILGGLVLAVGLWGRFWLRGGALSYLQPATRLGLMLLGGVLIFGGYWYSFGGVFGKPAAPKVWTTSGVTLAPELPSTPPQAAVEPPSSSAEAPAEELASQAEQAQQTQAVAPPPEVPAEIPVTSAEAAPASPAVENSEPVAETASAAAAVEKPLPEPAPLKPATESKPSVPEPAPPMEAAQTEMPVPPVRRKPRPQGGGPSAGAKVRGDGTVDVCAVQVQYGLVPANYGRRVATADFTRLTIRNALGPGQVREKLQLLIEGRKMASFEINRKKPSVSVSVNLPRGASASYSLSGTTEYEDGEQLKVSGGGWLEDGVRRYEIRTTGGWDARGGELFLEPAP